MDKPLNFDFMIEYNHKMSLIENLRKNSNDIKQSLIKLKSEIIDQNRRRVEIAILEKFLTVKQDIVDASRKINDDDATWTYEIHLNIPCSDIEKRFDIDVYGCIRVVILKFLEDEGFTVVNYSFSENKTAYNIKVLISWK